MQQQQGSVPSNEERIIKEMWSYLAECCKQERINRRLGIQSELDNRDIHDDLDQEEELVDLTDAAVGDVKVVLMAIFSIKGNKRMGIQPPHGAAGVDVQAEYSQNLNLKSPLQFGWINH